MSNVIESAKSKLTKELIRLEAHVVKVRKALAAIQAIDGAGKGIRAQRHPRRLKPKVKQAKPSPRYTKPHVHKPHTPKYPVPCKNCGKKFMAKHPKAKFCNDPCKANMRPGQLQQIREQAKYPRKGVTLLPGDPLKPAPSSN